MFSVNIDKLTKMTDKEAASYEEVAETLLDMCMDQCKSIAVVGEPRSAFKLAATVAKMDKKIFFVDADVSSEIFLSKYRLGKNLKGFTDYITGGASVRELKCVTNRDDVTIMFTGNIEGVGDIHKYGKRITALLVEALDDYDMVIVASDMEGDVASYCGGTVLIMKGSEYTEDIARHCVDGLDTNGCSVLGVVIDE